MLKSIIMTIYDYHNTEEMFAPFLFCWLNKKLLLKVEHRTKLISGSTSSSKHTCSVPVQPLPSRLPAGEEAIE